MSPVSTPRKSGSMMVRLLRPDGWRWSVLFFEAPGLIFIAPVGVISTLSATKPVASTTLNGAHNVTRCEAFFSYDFCSGQIYGWGIGWFVQINKWPGDKYCSGRSRNWEIVPALQNVVDTFWPPFEVGARAVARSCRNLRARRRSNGDNYQILVVKRQDLPAGDLAVTRIYGAMTVDGNAIFILCMNFLPSPPYVGIITRMQFFLTNLFFGGRSLGGASR